MKNQFLKNLIHELIHLDENEWFFIVTAENRPFKVVPPRCVLQVPQGEDVGARGQVHAGDRAGADQVRAAAGGEERHGDGVRGELQER